MARVVHPQWSGLGTSTGELQVKARLATAASLNATFLLTALERGR